MGSYPHYDGWRSSSTCGGPQQGTSAKVMLPHHWDHEGLAPALIFQFSGAEKLGFPCYIVLFDASIFNQNVGDMNIQNFMNSKQSKEFKGTHMPYFP